MAQAVTGTATNGGVTSFAPPSERVLIALGACLALIGAALFPPAAYSVDEAIYVDMANAMASRGAFDITPQDLPPGAPLMTKSDHLVQIVGEKAVPQYPGLYGVFAAPFFFFGGVKGLVLLNALCAIACLSLTCRIARILTGDEWTARVSTAMLGGASIFAGYAFAIWPHMLALSFVLGGALATLRAGTAAGRGRWLWACAAGLAFGFGVGVRIDVILAAVAAFFWLRLFATPSTRSIVIALAAGLAPGLLLAAVINHAKFGVFNPFTYGADAGAISISHHLKTIIPVAVAGAFALAIDVTAKPAATVIDMARRAPASAFAAFMVALAGAVWVALPNLYSGAWLMLVDIQSYAGPPRPGLERDVYGYWDFWGAPKKALAQSMPWMALALTPVALFFRGKRTKETAFLLLFAASVILFFAMRGWHGGMGYNMRYYLGAAPFIAILAAMGLNELRPAFDERRNLFLRSAIAGVALAISAYALSPVYDAFAVPSRLYPQLILAGVLGAVVLTAIFRPAHSRPKPVAAALAGAAIANAAIISIFDVNGYIADRARYAPYDRAYAEMIPADAVVFTQFDELLIGASLKGAMVARVSEKNFDEAAALIGAYEQAGRCVYVHTAPAAQELGPEFFNALPMPANAATPGLALFVYRDSPARCR